MPRPIRNVLVPAMLLVLCAMLASLHATPASAGPGKGRQDAVGVLPPQSNPYGASYGDWSARWWQWAYSLPVAGHPLFAETGADCGAGQSGSVWFLGGVFNVSGSATRDECVVPAGKALFFPILNVEWDNICPVTEPPLSNAELAAIAKWYIDGVVDMDCEVDGLPVRTLTAYRCTTGPFSVTFPAGGIFDYFCGTAPGEWGPMMGDGYYLMLAPLSQGDSHTIHFHATQADVGFTLDITYHLTPGQSPAAAVMMNGAPAPASAATMPWFKARAARVQGARNATWGTVKTLYR